MLFLKLITSSFLLKKPKSMIKRAVTKDVKTI